ncbi:MAG TPA: PSD1 and planctomycete cytochrome C domain-containing protein [Bryobacterales bacterium]|nr:PSD1 and planctomycete cytochrome C domain-containing protein [Bryobacterales bacterium]
MAVVKAALCLTFAAAMLPSQSVKAQSVKGQAADGFEFFEKKIRPLLADNCYACHSEKTIASGGLTLDTKQGVLKGGGRGMAVVPGSPGQSLMLRAASYEDADIKMPPTGKLSDAHIADLRHWIEIGAPDPRDGNPSSAAATADLAEARKFWAFQPVRNPEAPATTKPDWPKTFIDHFILAKLEQNGLSPAAPADKRIWLRRVSFDLTGLPPTPEEITNFLADTSPAARKTVVERLLASPHYGEKWARHWLDLVRYGETKGHEFDPDLPDAWRYRDYLIRAFNQDLPYDQFVKEHIAGDLLARRRLAPDGTHWDTPLATGFYALGEERNAADDVGQVRADHIDNQIDVYGKTFLGLTVGCARCHDHKFDPISANDYYALAGVMDSSQIVQQTLDSPARVRDMKKIGEEMIEINGQIAAIMRTARLERKHEIQSYLLAAAATVAAEDSSRRGAVPKPDSFGLDSSTVERWVEALKRAEKEPDNVFYPLARLAKPLPAGEQETTFAERVAQMHGELQDWTAKADPDHPANKERGDIVFADFEGADYGDWRASGAAFGESPSRYHAPNLALAGYQGNGIANSFAGGSDEWTGTLTSKSFAMEKPYLHVRLAGSERRTNRVVYGDLFFALVTSGRFRSLTADGSGALQWRTTDVKRTPGQVSYIEIVDRARDAHIVVDKIVFSDSKEPPPIASAPNPRIVELLAAGNVQSLEELAARYQDLLTRVLAAPSGDETDKWLLAALSPDGTLEDAALLVGETKRSDFERLQSQRAQLGAGIPDSVFGMLTADDLPRNARVHIRGSHTDLGEEVPRRFLAVLSGDEQPFTKGSGRFELAERTAGRDNPLTARVMVNRVWQHYFGKGIVATVDNFGNTGRRPTHPELLDAMAWRFMESGWSIKNLQRSIVLSSTYAMSSEADPQAAQIDGENTLLHHMPVRRLEAEAVRDSILAVTGTLDRAVYGPSITPFISPYQDGRGKPQSGPLDGDRRRSIYIKVQRNFINPLFLAFDYPTPVLTRGHRTVSTVPSQALMLMNNEFVARQAEKWADREIAAHPEWSNRIESMFLAAFGRQAEADELADSTEFLDKQLTSYGSADRDDYRVWADLAHVLINSKEFIFIR